MGLCTKLILLLIPIGVGFLYFKLTQNNPVPHVEDEYWGPASLKNKKEDTSIRPFKIETSASDLEDFKLRLKRELDSNRLVPPLEGIGFEYGFNSKYLTQVGQYWLSKYDWKAREALLNKFPQFKTHVGGLDIHFIHVKPKGSKPTRPVLLLHGWPGSIIEYVKIAPLLSEPKKSKYSYELIIPSLPGYGFSEGASRPGLDTVSIASIFRRLMERLGHSKYFVMGNDWGSLIASDLATLYPSSIIGVHNSVCPAIVSPTVQLKMMLAYAFPSLLASAEEAKYFRSVEETLSFTVRESGYLHLQGTKPDTVGVGLTHSPLGLAAYILEKFSTWTNRTWIFREDGGLTENFTLDELLDNVMIYWVSGSITTSARLYSEGLNPSKKHDLDWVPTNVPFDCHSGGLEVLIMPRFAIAHKFTNIHRYTVTSTGGHFRAFELPQEVADDAISFYDSL